MRRTSLVALLVLVALGGVVKLTSTSSSSVVGDADPSRDGATTSSTVQREHVRSAAPVAPATPVRRVIEGDVEDGDDRPIEGAEVTLYRLGGDGIGLIDAPEIYVGDPIATTSTTSNGTFALTTAVTGALAVVARKEGFAPGTDRVEDELALVTLDGGITHELFVRDESGRPVPGAEVSVLSHFSPSYSAAMTDADGRASVLAERGVSVRVRAAGYVPTEETVDPLTTRASPFVVTLEEGRPIAGTVVDADGMPLSGVHVTLRAGAGITPGITPHAPRACSSSEAVVRTR